MYTLHPKLVSKYYSATTIKNSTFLLSILTCRHFVKQLVGTIYVSRFYCWERWLKRSVARGSKGIEELHSVGATSLPARSRRWMQGCRGRPDSEGKASDVVLRSPGPWRWWRIRWQLLVERRGCASLVRPERRRRQLSCLLTGVGVASSPVWETAGGDVQLEMRRRGRGSGQRSCGPWRFAMDRSRLIGWENSNRPVLDGPDCMSARSNG